MLRAFPPRRDVDPASDKMIFADDGEIHLSSPAEREASQDPRGHVADGTDLSRYLCHV